jgi:hypothetical protein
MTKHGVLVLVLQLASSGADAWTTHRGLSEPGHFERNPLARPFVGSTAGQVAFFGGGAGIKLALPWALRCHGHGRMATVAEWTGIADSGVAAGNNVAELRRGASHKP